MNLIFLDIDGTLNSWRKLRDEPFAVEIQPECVVALNRIILATDAKLVISSSWRWLIPDHMSIEGFQRMLVSHGIRANVVGKTGDDMDERWQEISAWLRVTCGTYERYCVLDDDADAVAHHPGVVVKGYTGLTERDAAEAIEILTRT